MKQKIFFGFILIAVLPAIAFITVEGGASLLLFARDLVAVPRADRAEARHTTYDPELGWVNRTRVRIADMYGPGINLTTNAQGFRGSRDTPPRRPAGTFRMVCSGDSFTLGYGVSDDGTWCVQLAGLGRNVEAVNMGQGGYGLDQAYLWYRRDGAALEHDLLVFAFIYDDIRRTMSNRFLGYAKPTLTVSGDTLVVRDVPVPREGGGATLRRYVPVIRDLRSAKLLSRLVGGGAKDGVRVDPQASADSATWTMMKAVFEDLAARNRAKESTLLLVFLPTVSDFHQEWSTPWRERIAAFAAERGIAFVDLAPDLRAMPRESLRPLFIQDGELSFVGASGHYSAAGNRWVAARLRARLDSLAPTAFAPRP